MDPRSGLALRARARLGTVIRGKYRLDAVLGLGGMAIVYKATHRNQAEFAIKMLLPEISIDEELRARFLREGYAANSVKHPGAVQVVDDDVTEDGVAFLVMELLDGVAVEELCERFRRVPISIATAIGIQLLDVLASAHARGILHRDIKPANLFLTRDGTVKVLDFGIARVRDLASTGARLTATGVSFGTPAFMSPEQARGKSREIREATDLFAVGATLFTMISGRLVHEGETSAETMIKAATEPPTSVLRVAPDVPPQVAAVIDRALAFNAESRWPSAAAMRDALLAAHRQSFGEPSNLELAAYATAGAAMSVALESTRRVDAAPESPVSIFAGGTTSAPVSSDKRKATRRARGMIFAAMAGVAVALLVGGLLITLAHFARTTSQAAAPPPSVVASARETSAAAPSHPPIVADSPPPPIPRAISVSDLPTARPSAAARPTAVRPAASTKQPDCNPNYVLDSDGRKHFKPECF